MQAFDVTTGENLWTADPLSRAGYIDSLQNGIVYYSASNTKVLHAYNIRERKELWQKHLDDAVFEMTTLNSNTLLLKLGEFVLQSDNSYTQHIKGLVTIDLQQGKTKGQYPDPQQQASNIELMTWPVTVRRDGTFVYMNLSGGTSTQALTYTFTGFSPTCKQLWQVSFAY
ncbi:outer membrane protein assembly factor BamB family protein [Dictyobacter kobayashii]|uniref:Pyrrolo-quinoline quinone repeat domain-containing protein n=1 Tax=Dictyobacter kobayashii TaxID=2014872 RepID=A0A402AT95_9CHLR|nr:PQQ-binding-like beta-propeller repeat protein [Dictyobacter kobayashii]GCE22311.1 hypothetical protein KDK_61110 [Dictyobacter kobayashii]